MCFSECTCSTFNAEEFGLPYPLEEESGVDLFQRDDLFEAEPLPRPLPHFDDGDQDEDESMIPVPPGPTEVPVLVPLGPPAKKRRLGVSSGAHDQIAVMKPLISSAPR